MMLGWYTPVGSEGTVRLSCAVTELRVKVSLTPAPVEGISALTLSGHGLQRWVGVSPKRVLCYLLNSGISSESTLTHRVYQAPQYRFMVLKVIPGSVQDILLVFLESAFASPLVSQFHPSVSSEYLKARPFKPDHFLPGISLLGLNMVFVFRSPTVCLRCVQGQSRR